jgi:hypothetical protein
MKNNVLRFIENNVRNRIQYASSLYVDCFEKVIPFHLVKPAAPTLVLSGNIGKPSSKQTSDFLRHCSRNWDSVIYVPGSLELIEPLSKFNQLNSGLSNVFLLSCNRVKINGVVYIGSPLISMDDYVWLTREYGLLRGEQNIVAVTFGIPHINVLHYADTKMLLANKTTLYPAFNAWVCGYTRGANQYMFDNGVLVVYNARGRLGGNNDFDGSKGWLRDAVIDIPKYSEDMS